MLLRDADWPFFGLHADVRPFLRAQRAAGRAVALATLVRLEGSAPRPPGAQMLFWDDQAIGFFTGGCIEADIANHAAETLADGEPRLLVYGRGSPWIDIALPCGSRMEIAVERIAPDDPAVAALLADEAERRPAARDGVSYSPRWRLVLFGGDPVTLALAELGRLTGFEVILVRPNGPALSQRLRDGIDYRTCALEVELDALAVDAWTAIALATHDDAFDQQVLAHVLPRSPGYAGALGAEHRTPARRLRLIEAGVPAEAVARLSAPMGVGRCGKAPWEIAVSVLAEIMVSRAGDNPLPSGERDSPAQPGRERG